MLRPDLRMRSRLAYCFAWIVPARSRRPRYTRICLVDIRPSGAGNARAATEASLSIAATFEIEYLQYLDADGKLVRDDLPAIARDVRQLVELYKWMLYVRVFDSKAVALQRTGKLGTYASVSYTHLRAHETRHDLVCRLL